jgi:integrase
VRPGAPLTSCAFVKNLKGYAAEAEISHIHLHQTRHAYTGIVPEKTGSFLEAQEALDHESQATTRAYVQRIAVKRGQARPESRRQEEARQRPERRVTDREPVRPPPD